MKNKIKHRGPNTTQAPAPDGQKRLLKHVMANLSELAKVAGEGMAKQSGGAVICAIDEEFKTVSAHYVPDFAAAAVAKRTGLYDQYMLMSTICAITPWAVPLLVELHTTNDKLFYAVTQLDTRSQLC